LPVKINIKGTVFRDVEDDGLFVDFLVPGVGAFADEQFSGLDVELLVGDEDGVEEEGAAFDVFVGEEVFGAGFVSEGFFDGVVVSG
jgi:hypothetical protein